MTQISDVNLYAAYTTRDPRFDGMFYIGVKTTGIYCRPICPAKTPKFENCVFFKTAEEAERAAFRPCRRCHPHLAPKGSLSDNELDLANSILLYLEENCLEGIRLDDAAIHFGLSTRQIRRLFVKKFGLSPIKLLRTRRLCLARQLLMQSSLSITDVAFASGFTSVRRFNEAFLRQHFVAPQSFRQLGSTCTNSSNKETFTLELMYRPPFDWKNLIYFLNLHVLKGVELVQADTYLRTVKIGDAKGWLRVVNASQKNSLIVELSVSLLPAVAFIITQIRNLFDLDAKIDVINEHLMQDRVLSQAVLLNPGLRVPGSFDSFELAIRAILGQQISVKAATTLAGRLTAAFGESVETPYAGLQFFCPTAQKLASLQLEDLIVLGIIKARARTIISLSKAIVVGEVQLKGGLSPDVVMKQLMAIPGIGAWTAHYIAMRALSWPDAFPKEDIALRRVLGGVTAKRAEELSLSWRPWRSYATLHLWQMYLTSLQ